MTTIISTKKNPWYEDKTLKSSIEFEFKSEYILTLVLFFIGIMMGLAGLTHLKQTTPLIVKYLIQLLGFSLIIVGVVIFIGSMDSYEGNTLFRFYILKYEKEKQHTTLKDLIYK